MMIDLGDTNSPLLKALMIRDYKVSKMLINENKYLEDKTSLGVSPLMIAAYYGMLEIVELLIKKGSDPEDVDDLQRNAIFFTLLGFKT